MFRFSLGISKRGGSDTKRTVVSGDGGLGLCCGCSAIVMVFVVRRRDIGLLVAMP